MQGLDEENLFNASALLKNLQFYTGDYHLMTDRLDKESFVFLDPPYRPVSDTSTFKEYCRSGFNDNNQRELASLCKELSVRGASLMISNSDLNL